MTVGTTANAMSMPCMHWRGQEELDSKRVDAVWIICVDAVDAWIPRWPLPAGDILVVGSSSPFFECREGLSVLMKEPNAAVFRVASP